MSSCLLQKATGDIWTGLPSILDKYIYRPFYATVGSLCSAKNMLHNMLRWSSFVQNKGVDRQLIFLLDPFFQKTQSVVELPQTCIQDHHDHFWQLKLHYSIRSPLLVNEMKTSQRIDYRGRWTCFYIQLELKEKYAFHCTTSDHYHGNEIIHSIRTRGTQIAF